LPDLICDASPEMDYRSAVRNEIDNVLHELGFVTGLVTKQAQSELDDVEIRAAALSLSTIYSGIEKILLYVLKDHVGRRPEGPNWHTELLELAEGESLISKDVQSELKSYLAFRHFVRHAYSFELKVVMIKEILSKAPDLVHRLVDELRANYLEVDSSERGGG
jgi:uncharacterized protein YutE (UPF0331/DUF86 family)